MEKTLGIGLEVSLEKRDSEELDKTLSSLCWLGALETLWPVYSRSLTMAR